MTASLDSRTSAGIAQTATRQQMIANANRFAHEWAGEKRERAEKDSFWNEFFEIFGISRRRVGGVFEYHAQRHSTGGYGWIDLFWPGKIAVEHKSLGQDLAAAMDQLVDYLTTLPDVDQPALAVVCDFERFVVRDLEHATTTEFKISDLSKRIEIFAFLAGYSKHSDTYDEESANLEATQLLADLHDRLAEFGYPAHDLSIFLVRILYILFADDTQVWEKNLFEDFISVETREDGSNLGRVLMELFDVLDTRDRMSSLSPTLQAFEYVNGGLFADPIRTPSCDRKVREALLAACRFEWSVISPVIFGSLFQNVMTPADRRKLGAHYTTERDILRALNPLFLDDLREELQQARSQPGLKARLNALRRLRAKLPTIKILDPACGVGNFLMVAFRELRAIELQVQLEIREAEGTGSEAKVFDIDLLRQVKLNQFYGIEIEEFPAKIAETALHLADHQANMQMARAFGEYVPSLPLSRSAEIVIANALRTDWNEVLPSKECSYVVGNPPFVGISLRTAENTNDLQQVWGSEYHGTMDYVSGWYKVATKYMKDTDIRAAFVSTNSITQGEQTAVVWNPLFERGLTVEFAHRTFKWISEAKGTASVHVVIVGFSLSDNSRRSKKTLFYYETLESEPSPREVSSISPYLVPGPQIAVPDRSTPLSPDLPEVHYGNKPSAKGFTITKSQIDEFLADPIAKKYVRPYVGARELTHNLERWCLWLVDSTPADRRNSPLIAERIEAVRRQRTKSKAVSTQDAAATAHLFRQIVQPVTDYVCIPIHGSSKRRYFPVKHLPQHVIASNATFVAEDPDGVLFSVISSSWFMVWQDVVGGKIKSDPRFNKLLVWNTFPMPRLSERNRVALIDAGSKILATRDTLDMSLSEMYESDQMPPSLLSAHKHLDKVLDRTMAPRKRIRGEADRLEVLMSLYAKLVNEGRIVV